MQPDSTPQKEPAAHPAIQPGTVLYRQRSANGQLFEAVTVATVGRTYFTIEEKLRGRYRLSNLLYDTNYGSAKEQLYRTSEEILIEIETTKLRETITKAINFGEVRKLTLDQLRGIAAILEQPTQ